MAAAHPDWVVGFADETWWRRLAQPPLHAWGAAALRLAAKARTKDDAESKALACYGLLRADSERVWLRFVAGRPVSRVTTDFLSWVLARLAKEGKQVLVLVWDNAGWHVSRAVQDWVKRHNRTAKRCGGLRPLVLPEEVAQRSLTTLREKLIKIGAPRGRVYLPPSMRHGRYVVFQLAEVAVPCDLFAATLCRTDRVRGPPVMVALIAANHAAAGAEGEPCAEIDQRHQSSPGSPFGRDSAALLTRVPPPDLPSC